MAALPAVTSFELLSNFKRRKFHILFLLATLISATIWVPAVAGIFPGVPNPPNANALTTPHYDPLFSGSMFYPFLAVVLTMDTFAGEFESKSIEILFTKSSKGAIFLGKLLGGLLTAIATIAVLMVSEIAFSTVFYGPQSNLTSLPIYFVGSSFSFLVWFSLAIVVALATKNVLFTILGVLGYLVVEQLLDPFMGLFIPGYGPQLSIPNIGTGSAALGSLLPYYSQSPGAAIMLPTCSTPCIALSWLVFQAVTVGAIYIIIFLTAGYYLFNRKEAR
jgi:ABC-type transport system involved in multi-copper enzyme maturation permease subunit